MLHINSVNDVYLYYYYVIFIFIFYHFTFSIYQNSSV